MSHAEQPKNSSARPGGLALLPAPLRDIRELQVIGQIIFVLVVVTIVSQIGSSVLASLQAKGLTPNLGFLQNRGGFDISEHPEWYNSDSTFGGAFIVGFTNTLRIAIAGLILSTLVGIILGIALLSRNWLVRNLSRWYVEILRNTPLIVQLFVWYFIVMLTLPDFKQSLTLPAEGIWLLSVRLLLYIVGYGLALVFMSLGNADPLMRRRIQYGFVAAAASIEINFWLDSTRYGTGAGSWAFLIYAALSVILIGVVWYTAFQQRELTLIIAVGQAIGGLLFYWGIIPNSALRIDVQPAFYLSRRGLAFPELLPTARFAEWMTFVVIGIVLAGILWSYFGRLTETTGRPYPRGWYVIVSIVGLALVGLVITATEPAPATIPVQKDGQTAYMSLDDARNDKLLTRNDELLYNRLPLMVVLPEKTNFKFTAGVQLSTEYSALLIGLVVYTSVFIGEIVRAGIQAVAYGQMEAARALGLSNGQMLRLVVLPQALRVIIPPLGNQYLNLTKNSSLAIAIAFPDLFQVTTTIMNTSGQSVTGIFMVMLTYLALSLITSLFMNLANRRFQLVTR